MKHIAHLVATVTVQEVIEVVRCNEVIGRVRTVKERGTVGALEGRKEILWVLTSLSTA